MIEWSKDLAVGVEEIDKQHQEIFAAINRLLQACNQGKGKEAVGDTLNFLGNYVHEHFAAEEELMQKHQYPEVTGHKAQHRQFIKDLSELQAKYNQEGNALNVVIATNRTVVQWLQHHIMNTDKILGQYIKAKQVRGKPLA